MTGRMQPTAAEINEHLKTKLKKVVAHLPGPLKLRVIAARVGIRRNGKTPLIVQIMGWEGFTDGGWCVVEPDARIDLL
jgi:hypothetical protein